MKAAIGLGNPGLAYALSRHNVGFHVIDLYRQVERRVGRGRRRCSARVYRHGDLLLAKPMTGMNASGEAVSRLVSLYALHPQDLLLIHDDLDLPLGRMRIVPGGGAGTHKGVLSVHETLETCRVPRMKIGIEAEDRELDGATFVLRSFSEGEWNDLSPILRRAAAAIAAFRRHPLDQVMTEFNTEPGTVAAA